MDSAFSTVENRMITASEFQRSVNHNAALYWERQGTWECVGDCGDEAWFSRGKVRAPRFSSFHGGEECTEKSDQRSSEPGPLEESTQPRTTNTGGIILDLNPRDTREGITHADGDPDGHRRGHRTNPDTENEVAFPHQHNLVGLLNRLKLDRTYAADEEIHIPGGHSYPGRDLIRHLDDLNLDEERENGRNPRIAWGTIRDSSFNGNRGYLNQDVYKKNRAAVVLSKDLSEQLLTKYKVESFREFIGWYVITYAGTREMRDGKVGVNPRRRSIALQPKTKEKRPRQDRKRSNKGVGA